MPETRLLITPALEVKFNERQKEIVKHTVETGSVNTGWCIENLGIVRDTAHRDLLELVKWGILVRQGSGRGLIMS